MQSQSQKRNDIYPSNHAEAAGFKDKAWKNKAIKKMKFWDTLMFVPEDDQFSIDWLKMKYGDWNSAPKKLKMGQGKVRPNNVCLS